MLDIGNMRAVFMIGGLSVRGSLARYAKGDNLNGLLPEQVPEVLLSGHHANIEKWRRRESVIRTAKNRPDLLARAELTEEEKTLARKILEETGKA